MKSLKTTARWTGLGYLIIFISGFFANFYTLEGMMADGNAQLTALNIASQTNLFQLGIASFCIMIVLDILLAFPLYRLLKTTSEKCAKLSSFIRVINGLVFMVALVYLFKIIPLAENGATALEGSVLELLADFNTMWNVGLLFFGVHLLILGWLLVRSQDFPGLIGFLLQLAGLAYLADSGAQLFLPNYQDYQTLFEMLVIGGGVIGEFSLTLWLLIKGVRYEKEFTRGSDAQVI